MAQALNPGSRVGAYTIERVLGRGGMGVVHGAVDANGHAVALKLLVREIGVDPDSRRRFAREALAVAKIRHENVARLIETGEHEGLPYLVFELVPGGSLRARIEREGPLSADEVLRLALPIARGLIAVHAAGVIHRDLKPDNVLMGADGSPKIADFGLVRRAPGRSSLSQLGRLTQPGDFLGTPAFMAPEQIQRPDEVDERADLYAFGATLFALLTLRPPFTGEGLVLLSAVLTEAPPRVGSFVTVPPALDDLIAALLAKEPAARPASAAAVLAALEAIAAPRGRASEPTLRKPGALVAVAVAFALGAAAIGFGAGRSSGPGQPPASTLSPSGIVPTPGSRTPTPAAVTSARARTPEPKAMATSPRPAPSEGERGRFPSFCREFVESPPTRLKRIHGTYRWHVAPGRAGTCAFLPDGRPVTGWADGRVRVLDRRTGEETATIDVGAPVLSFATFKDGRRILVGLGGGLVEGWDLETATRLFRLPELEAPSGQNVRRVAITSDESAIVALASNGRLAVWDAKGATPSLRWKKALPPTATDSWGGALSPDESSYLTGSRDGHLRIWKMTDGELLRDLGVISPRGINVCFFAGDGKTIVAGTSEPSFVVVDAESGKSVFSAAGDKGAVRTFAGALSTDQKTLVVATDNVIDVWDLTTRSRLLRLAGHTDMVRELAFSPDGASLLSTGNDGVFRVWDVATGADKRGDVTPFEGLVRALAVSADGKTALVATADGRVRVVSWPGGEVEGVLESAVPSVAVAISSDGSRALTRGENGSVQAWDVPSRRIVRSFTGDTGNIGLAFRGDGQPLVPLGRTTLAVVNWDDGATLWSIADGVRAAQFTSDDRLLTASASGLVKLWKGSTGALADSTPKMPSPQVWAMETKLGTLTAELDKVLRLLPRNALSKPPLWEVATPAPVSAAALSLDERTAVVLCGDAKHTTSIMIRDVATGNEMGGLDLSASCDAPTALAQVPGTSSFLVGTARGVILELEIDRPN